MFQWAFSGPNGLDPYAFAVSDVYQDLFEEGSFVGKGIYDVDVFEQALEGAHSRKHRSQPRPAGRRLCARRAGFRCRSGGGISLALRRGGGAPASLGARRLAVAALDIRRRAQAVPLLGRWKMLDNLRRSLSAPAHAACPSWSAGCCRHEAALVWTVVPGAGRSSCRRFCRSLSASFRGSAAFRCAAMRRNMTHDTVLAITADPVQRHVPGPHRLSGAGCHPAHPLPAVRQPQEPAGMGHLRPDRLQPPRRLGQGLGLQMAGSLAFVAVVGRADRRCTTWPICARPSPFLALWGFSPADGALGQPGAAGRAASGHVGFGHDRACGWRRAAPGPSSRPSSLRQDNCLPPDNFQEDPSARWRIAPRPPISACI